MVANPVKFQLMFLGNKTSENYSFSLSRQIISKSNEVELLGIIIDNKLNFSSHIKKVCKNANNKISAFINMRNLLDFSQAKDIYNAYILPFFLLLSYYLDVLLKIKYETYYKNSQKGIGQCTTICRYHFIIYLNWIIAVAFIKDTFSC